MFFLFYCLLSPLYCRANISLLVFQMPDASISVPMVTGTMPDVSGDVPVPSVGVVDVDVAAPSAGVDASAPFAPSAPSASVDLPGEFIYRGTEVVPIYRGIVAMPI